MMQFIKINIIFFLLFVAFYAKGQTTFSITKDNADCVNAIELNDTVYGPTNAPEGFGKVMEIAGDKSSLYNFEKEHNTVWYRIEIPNNCTLSFDIKPLNKKDDYDFLLYKWTDENFCKDIKDKKLKPVRSNISRNEPNINSITGLSATATEEFIRSGPGAQFTKPIEVKQGEVYYLVVDNVYPKGEGHTLSLHYSKCEKIPEPEAGNESKVIINVIDHDSGALVESNIEIYKTDIKGAKKPDYKYEEKSSCFVSLELGTNYSILINAKAYLNYYEEIKLDKKQRRRTINAEIERIGVGKKFQIENMFFYERLAKFLPTSKPALEQLLRFMKINPTVSIEIQGNINWPLSYGKQTKKDIEFSQKLSEDRAKAVLDYLKKNKISEERMKFKGYGSSKMMFPEATTPRQMQQNRRVDIMILSE